MLSSEGIVYEVRFEVADRSAFDEWFSNAVVGWATLPGVQRFRIYRGVDGDRQWLRVTLGFEEYADWNAFVQLERHRETMARLEDVSTAVRTSLWAPSAVALGTDGPALVERDVEVTDGTAAADDVSGSVSDAVTEP